MPMTLIRDALRLRGSAWGANVASWRGALNALADPLAQLGNT